jgi:hypothetical protein
VGSECDCRLSVEDRFQSVSDLILDLPGTESYYMVNCSLFLAVALLLEPMAQDLSYSMRDACVGIEQSID